MGSLAILNAGKGDIKISYDKANALEAVRAKRIITDMLKRGYALFVEVDGRYTRAARFNEKQSEYIIADYDPTTDEKGEEDAQVAPQQEEKKAKRGRPRKTVSMEKVNAVAVGRSAGG